MCPSALITYQVIEDLASEGHLNGQTFCIQCMARHITFSQLTFADVMLGSQAPSLKTLSSL